VQFVIESKNSIIFIVGIILFQILESKTTNNLSQETTNFFSNKSSFAEFIFSSFDFFSITKFLSPKLIFNFFLTFSEKVKANTGKLGL
jgi:hypothetical protein